MFWVALKQIVLYSTELKINKNRKNRNSCTIEFAPNFQLNLYEKYSVQFFVVVEIWQFPFHNGSYPLVSLLYLLADLLFAPLRTSNTCTYCFHLEPSSFHLERILVLLFLVYNLSVVSCEPVVFICLEVPNKRRKWSNPFKYDYFKPFLIEFTEQLLYLDIYSYCDIK